MKKLSLVSKITWLIALILIVPIFVVCYIYFREFQDSMLQEADNKLKENLSTMEMMMDKNLETIDAVINELNYRQEFPYFLDAKNVLSKKEQSYYALNMQRELINIRYLYPNKFHYIAIYASNTQVNRNYDRQYKLDDLKEKPYYEEIIGNSDDISYGKIRPSEFKVSNINVNQYNLDDTEALILPTYLKIYNLSTRDIVGIMEVDMEVSKLIDYDALKNLDTGLSYLLFDQNNQLLYQTSNFTQESFSNINLEADHGSGNFAIDEDIHMFIYSKCARTGLVRVILFPKEKAMVFANEMIQKLILVAASGICIIALLIYWIIRKMLNRLLVLDAMMAKIEAGTFDVTIEDSKNDEISRITRTFNRMASRLNQVIASAVDKENAKKEAELQALQAQINPHFLYNTLENVRMQCEIDGYYTIGDNLAILGDLFRYSIKWGKNEVPFELEWSNLKNYISIMQMRFEDDIKCNLKLEERLGEIIVPKLMLQPLVENSFNHGFRNVLPPWIISVSAYKKENNLIIEIEDNGIGIEKDRLEQLKFSMENNISFENPEEARKSIGVVNVKQRIEMICKPGSKIEIESQTGAGTKIVITIILEGE